MRTAKVDGTEIPEEAVKFEQERLVRFYAQHGFGADEIRKTMPQLEDKALEQAIGAKLLFDHASKLDIRVDDKEIEAEAAKVAAQAGGAENLKRMLSAQGIGEAAFRFSLARGIKVNKLVEKACRGVDDPTDAEVARCFEENRHRYPGRTLVDVYDSIKDLLRHASRSRALELFIDDLRAKAKIEYSVSKRD